MLLAVIVGVVVTALAVGAAGAADAADSPPTGYYPFLPADFGDASDCQILGSSFGTAHFVNQPVVGIAVTPKLRTGLAGRR